MREGPSGSGAAPGGTSGDWGGVEPASPTGSLLVLHVCPGAAAEGLPMGQECAGAASPPDPIPVRDPAEVPVLGRVWLEAGLSVFVAGGDIKPCCQCPRGQGAEAVQ